MTIRIYDTAPHQLTNQRKKEPPVREDRGFGYKNAGSDLLSL